MKWIVILAGMLLLMAPAFAWDNLSFANRSAVNVTNLGSAADNVAVKFAISPGLCAQASNQDARFYYNNSGSYEKIPQEHLPYDNSTLIVILPYAASGTNNAGYIYCGNASAENNDTLIYIVEDTFNGASLNISTWTVSLNNNDYQTVSGGQLNVFLATTAEGDWVASVIYNNYTINKTEATLQGLTALVNQSTATSENGDVIGGFGFGNLTVHSLGYDATGTYLSTGISDEPAYFVATVSTGDFGSLCQQDSPWYYCKYGEVGGYDSGTFFVGRISTNANDNVTKYASGYNGNNLTLIGDNSTTNGIFPEDNLRARFQFQDLLSRHGIHHFEYAGAWYGNVSVETLNMINPLSGSVENQLVPDTTPPVVTTILPLNTTYPQYFDLNFTASDDVAIDQCWYSLGLVNVTLTSCDNTTAGLASGTYTITYYANDTSGNIGNNTPVTFTVDADAPVLNITYPATLQVLATKDTAINWTTNEPLSYCEYSINANPYAPLSCNITSIPLSGMLNGTYNVYIRIYDLVNNSIAAGVSFYVQVPLEISIISPANTSYLIFTNISLNVSIISGNGLDTCWYIMDAEAPVYNCLNVTFAPDENPHTLAVYANDTIGNSASSSVSFTVYSVPPPPAPGHLTGTTRLIYSFIPVIFGIILILFGAHLMFGESRKMKEGMLFIAAGFILAIIVAQAAATFL